MNRLRALRYLGGALAASGGGLGSSGVPAACKERGSNGGDKQQQQQQQQQQQPGFLGDWLQKPPAAIGNAAAARWRMRNLLTSLQVRLHLLDLPVSFDEATKKDSVGGQMKEEKREPTTATATTATEAAEAAAAAAAESGKGLQNKKRLRVVVVGGGWSSSSFVSSLDPRQFEVVWISPEEHLSYTPLLPCVCGGALPAAACTTSLRGLLSFGGKAEGRGRYYQAVVDNVDLNNNRVVCRPVLSLAETSSSGERGSWEEAYDYLILGVGSEVNTFNIPGVQQHALFLKTAADAERIRGRLKCCLEAAASANISEKERQELLTFVIVGAGPSGVEAAAEIQDFLNTTGARVYPQLQQYFKVVLLEMGSVPLPMYNTQVQQSLGNTFSKSGVDLRLNARVVAVGPSHVQVRRMQPAAAAAVTAAVRDTLTATRGGGASKDSSAAAGGGTSAGGAAAGAAAAAATSPAPATTTTAAAAAATDECIPTRFVLWASGVRPTSLALSVAKGLKQQVRPQRLLVSPNLQVLGTNNVFALGDCCCIQPPPLQVYAQQLFNLAKKGDSHKGAGTEWLLANGARLSTLFPQLHPKRNKLENIEARDNLNLQQFTELLKEIDGRYMSPAPTAQNARQEGKYLALLFNTYLGPKTRGGAPKGAPLGGPPLPAFVETWKGSLCLLGEGTAALELPVGTFIGGLPYSLVWKLVYLQLQFSYRAAWRCCEGWVQTAVFGRDIHSTSPSTSAANK